LPCIVGIGLSYNAQTVRKLLQEFQTMYILVNVVGFYCLALFLFRDHPAKMFALGLLSPSNVASGFADAYLEGGRVVTSRLFFALNIAALLIYLALYSFKLGLFTDFIFEVTTFTFVASSMACSSITTLLVFGCKNLFMSFYRPGSLVVLTSAVCCVLLDADTLAVLKAGYSLQGQALGKYRPNQTVERQLRKHRASIVASAPALMIARNAVAPADQSLAAEMLQEDEHRRVLVGAEELGIGEDDGHGYRTSAWPGSMTDAEPALSPGSGCAPFDMRTGASTGPGIETAA
jgi:hypothetical protein